MYGILILLLLAPSHIKLCVFLISAENATGGQSSKRGSSDGEFRIVYQNDVV